MSWLITPQQLDRFRKNQRNVAILDASWGLSGVNPAAQFAAGHIPGARFIDLNDFHDPLSSLPNMLINDPELIEVKLKALGLSEDQKIIIYDHSPLQTACRAIWMLKVFGHPSQQLYLLNGGLAAWHHYNSKLEVGPVTVAPSKQYSVKLDWQCIRTLTEMKSNLQQPAEQVIDVRHPVRFAGGPESRSDMRAGHIPGSFCFPFITMFDTNGLWKPLERIRKQLLGIGVELDYPIVSSCGSGITAAILDVALDLLNHENHAVYDGSWSEWGSSELYAGEKSLDERPVETSLS